MAERPLSERVLEGLLEHYFVWCLGELEPEWAEKLDAVAPQLGTKLNLRGQWHEVIARLMAFESDLPNSVRELWARNSEIAKHRGETLTPRQFAKMLIQSNFFAPSKS